jgi:pyochelin biosynthetic protein PchC
MTAAQSPRTRFSGTWLPDTPWIQRFERVADPSVRLVSLPHAGGSASYYLPVARALAPLVEVLAVQYPGRQSRLREPLVDDIQDLADRVFEAIRPVAAQPVALFGHSMGAIVAYEVARRLARHDYPDPVHLFVSARRAPSVYRNESLDLDDDQSLLAELRSLGGTGPEVLDDPEVLEMIMPALRADYRAIDTYRYLPGPPLNCPITILVGDSDPKASVEDMRAWRDHTTKPAELQVFRGGHFYLEEHGAQVTEMIRDRLRPAAAGGR